MSLYVLDTDVLSHYARGTEPILSRVDACPRQDRAITVITVEEQVSGWYTLLRQARRPSDVARAYRALADCVHFLADWTILPYTEAAMARVDGWSGMKLRVKAQDLRIAAIALEHNAIVVTRNLRDFNRIPGATTEDWGA